MKIINSFVLSVAVCLLVPSMAAAQQMEMVFDRAADFVLASKAATTTFVVDDREPAVVKTVAEAVGSDLQMITGGQTAVTATAGEGTMPVIAGTIGRGGLIDRLISQKKIDARSLSGKWEAYAIEVVKKPVSGVAKALVVCGSTPRGTAYGLFHLSRMAGVSPWVWWADVKPGQHESVAVKGRRMEVGEPSVQYRGIFINDEDWGLKPWAAKMMDKKLRNIGPNTYEKVLELLLRLRANTLWPAMHDCSKAFWSVKDNVALAKKYDIVLGSSHCESLLRNNVKEWEAYGGEKNNYRWTTNKEMVQPYWSARVGQSKDMDCIYTLGMRGVHDGSIQGYKGPAAIRDGLTEIIAWQRQLLQDSLHHDITKVPQMFCPYKEVLSAYNAGLKVPDDVMICWVNDNHGYIRQLPNAKEQQRSGGHGMYYHLSYWGSPYDYLWLTSTSPALISYELSKAYENNVRKMWMINVGDIKPAEMELEFCMELAWDVQKWQPQQAINYIDEWAAATFGKKVGAHVAAIKKSYYTLAASGKPEHVYWVDFTEEEMRSRMAAYEALAQQVDAVKDMLSDRQQDAFFQLVEYPVKGAWLMNVKTLQKRLGNDEAAEKAYQDIQTLTKKYNTEVAGGKWNGIMNAAPHNVKTNVFSAPKLMKAPEAPVAGHRVVTKAAAYTQAGKELKTIYGLGATGEAVCVLPVGRESYQDTNAPYAEYVVEMKQGQNDIEVMCLPTFPLNADYQLRFGLQVDGGEMSVHSIKTQATKGDWSTNVLNGYAVKSITYQADKAKKVKVRVYFLDPSIVLTGIRTS